jgi:hypothetical protein
MIKWGMSLGGYEMGAVALFETYQGGYMKLNRVVLLSALVLAGVLARPVLADPGAEEIKDQLGAVQDEIISLQDLKNDKALRYNRHLYKLTLALIQNQIDDAVKAGNTDRVNNVKAEMVAFTQEHDATWDENIALLDANCKREQLLADYKIFQFRAEAKNAELTNPKKARVMEENISAWTKNKPLIDQRYEITKQIAAAREKEDYKTATELYQKLKEIRAQQRQIDKEISKVILQLQEKNAGEEPLNL